MIETMNMSDITKMAETLSFARTLAEKYDELLDLRDTNLVVKEADKSSETLLDAIEGTAAVDRYSAAMTLAVTGMTLAEAAAEHINERDEEANEKSKFALLLGTALTLTAGKLMDLETGVTR